MEDDTKDMFEPKPLSEQESQLIIESMEGLSNLGIKESRLHVRNAYLEYFNKLKQLIVEYKPHEPK